MIVVLRPGASVAEIAEVVRRAEALGLRPHPSRGADRTIVGVVGVDADRRAAALAELPGVEKVVPAGRSFQLVSRDFRPSDTVVRIGDVGVGGEEFVVMAGPCAVEGREQLFETAQAVQAAGARVLRGGAFKPRTSPYSFQGLKEEGLRLLARAREITGLPVVTEVLAPEMVEIVARYADALQIGARNMQNYALLEAVGSVRKPVLLKRGLMSTVEELLLAAEYVASAGNDQIVLCERGIRTFERATRNTLDLAAVPLLKKLSHLPVIVDPSHAVGIAEFVPAMARAALVAGADGLLVEVHPDPGAALCDGPQSLRPTVFRETMDDLRRMAPLVGRRVGRIPGGADRRSRAEGSAVGGG